MRKHGRTKSHFIRTKLVIEIKKLRDKGISYKEISRTLSIRFKKHFSVGLIHMIYNERMKKQSTNLFMRICSKVNKNKELNPDQKFNKALKLYDKAMEVEK